MFERRSDCVCASDSSSAIAPGTMVFVPEGLSIEQLDQQARDAVTPFLLGLSSPACVASGVAFMCSQVFHACAQVALPDGTTGTVFDFVHLISRARDEGGRVSCCVLA